MKMKNINTHFVFSIILIFILSSPMKAQYYCDWPWQPPPANPAFNWKAEDYQMYIYPNISQLRQSPFHATGANLNPNIYDLAWYSDKDYQETDGWVYVKHDFGTPTNFITNPFLILYNRFSGMLRVFFLMTEPHANTNRGVVTLKFREGSKKSAALEIYNKSKTKNGFGTFSVNDNEGAIPNYWSTETPYWTHADFAMTYDPCTCERSSEFWVSLKLGSNSTITLNTSGQASQQIKAGLNNSQFSAGTFVKSSSTGLGIIENIFKAGDVKADASTLGQLVGLFGGAGKMFALADFFLGLFNPSEPAKPTPMIFNVKLNSTGEIGWDGNGKTVTLQNPGSDRTGVDVDNYSHWNHILGVFNILEKPVINVTSSTDLSNFYYCESNGDWGDCGSEVVAFKFHTPNPIKWAINPYANLQVDDIRAAYVFDFYSGKRVMSKSFSLGCFQDFEHVISRTRTFNGPNQGYVDSEELPSDVHIQVIVSCTAPNGAKFSYTSVFDVQGVGINVANDLTGTGVEPPSNCTTINPAAGWSDIQAVCTSSAYVNRTQSVVAPTDTTVGQIIAKQRNERVAKLAHTAKSDLKIVPSVTDNISSFYYKITKSGRVKLYLSDMTGRIVNQYINSTNHNSGNFEAKFERGNLGAGVYFVVLETENGRTTQKFVVQ